ncbi:hypothetical protein, variant 2 [Aphanomyces invadans]|uniref:Uncharacterized protein n=1 Tax=Aphanomyces invadans TaxID=157072 RepID=A0A024TVJ7_9STRA|nr:hypothetical protein, variant 2 [Aphanomyces invadans]XP_008874066.1 hypothetical protein, variant 1 [Aphanomyces invadans]ETV97357.1 hypothetical protein, variant 1 [Aphanomyces invadans]ETV97358.1 hypothetical protein, variant 2 [Aphanomyces invadans]|eukprot:XP_008874064.1 hypothetical protein, variant 2 [Aphanomyces invadans]
MHGICPPNPLQGRQNRGTTSRFLPTRVALLACNGSCISCWREPTVFFKTRRAIGTTAWMSKRLWRCPTAPMPQTKTSSFKCEATSSWHARWRAPRRWPSLTIHPSIRIASSSTAVTTSCTCSKTAATPSCTSSGMFCTDGSCRRPVRCTSAEAF